MVVFELVDESDFYRRRFYRGRELAPSTPYQKPLPLAVFVLVTDAAKSRVAFIRRDIVQARSVSSRDVIARAWGSNPPRETNSTCS